MISIVTLAYEDLYHFSLFKNEFQKPKKLKESPIKFPSIPLFPPGQRPKGEANISCLWRFSPAGGRQREAGRDFQSAKVLRIFQFSISNLQWVSRWINLCASSSPLRKLSPTPRQGDWQMWQAPFLNSFKPWDVR